MHACEWISIIAFTEADKVFFDMIQQTHMDETLFGEKPVMTAACFEKTWTNEVGIVLHLL